MKDETVITLRTVFLVSTLGLVGYLIDQKLKEKKIVKETVKEHVLIMESL